jgi:hypothetical protein
VSVGVVLDHDATGRLVGIDIDNASRKVELRRFISPHLHMTTLPDGPWSVASGDSDGKPIFIRINTGASAVSKLPAFGHRVGIAVSLQAPDASGLPTPDEAATLSQIEEAVEAALRVGHETILVVVLTTGGMREFVLYSAAPQNIEAAIGTVQARFPSHEIQFYIQPDADWDAYASFTDVL